MVAIIRSSLEHKQCHLQCRAKAEERRRILVLRRGNYGADKADNSEMNEYI